MGTIIIDILSKLKQSHNSNVIVGRQVKNQN